MARIAIYDTTLRDGSQGEGINFSLQDKLLITRRLDELGVDFIEGGYPLSNPKDFEYFHEVAKLPLRHARVAAFGMTRRRDIAPQHDIGLKALIDAGTPAVTIVGKSYRAKAQDGFSQDTPMSQVTAGIAINGASGDDTITIGPDITLPTTLIGGDGNEIINGGAGRDREPRE